MLSYNGAELYDGVLVSAANLTQDGVSGGGATSTTMNSYIGIGANNGVALGNAFSAALWFRNPSVVDGGVVFFGSQFGLQVLDGQFALVPTIGASIPFVSVNVADTNDGEWHHLVLVQNGLGLRLYVDGQLSVPIAMNGSFKKIYPAFSVAKEVDEGLKLNEVIFKSFFP